MPHTSPTEPCSERLHCMIRPTTKTELDIVARGDLRFKSEGEVVRYLLETYLPGMAGAVKRAGEPDVTVVDEPTGPRIAATPVSVSRDLVERSRPRVSDSFRAATAEAIRRHEASADRDYIDAARAAEAPAYEGDAHEPRTCVGTPDAPCGLCPKCGSGQALPPRPVFSDLEQLRRDNARLVEARLDERLARFDTTRPAFPPMPGRGVE